MNTLGYRPTEDNGLSFELLVDGQPLGELVGSPDTAIPYWLFEDDLPSWGYHSKEHDSETRIVVVCSCGESGCGHTQCQVVREGDTVTFRNFKFDVSPEGAKKVFRFLSTNYEAVISAIIEKANQYKANTEAVIEVDNE